MSNVTSFVSWNQTRIVFVVPAGRGANFTIRVLSAINWWSLPSAAFRYAGPSISEVRPATGSTDGFVGNSTTNVTVITVFGLDFTPFGRLYWNGTQVNTTSWSRTNITFNLPAGQGRNTPVRVTTWDSDETTFSVTNSTFTYLLPAPATLTSVDFRAGSVLTITGLNFGLSPSVVVGFGSFNCPVVNSTHRVIRCTLPVGQGLNQPLRVTAGNQTSVVAPSTPLNYPRPNITSQSPTQVATIGGAVLTITGFNFGLAVPSLFAGYGTHYVSFNGMVCNETTTNCSVLSWNDTVIIYSVPAGPIGGVRNQPVQVFSDSQLSNVSVVAYIAPNIT